MKKLFPLLLLVTVFLGCSKPTVLNQSMEEMGSSFKPMYKADSLEVIQQQLDGFKAGLEIAKAEKVKPEDQATFEEGMEKLQSLVVELDAALAAKDLPKSQELIKTMGDTRKKYHKKLGVKKK